jgi:hypothetical protein
MSISKLPAPNPGQLKAAHQVAADIGTQFDAFPSAEECEAAFPDLYRESPDGKWSVDYRNPGLTAAENERNSRRVQDMLRPYQAVCAATTGARDAQVETVTVRGRDGVVMTLPARAERTLARKGQVTAVRHYGRATRYMQDKAGRWWKREHRGDWQLEGGR